MSPISRLVLPPRELADCIVCCLYRDTRGAVLTEEERLNYFPASPLFAASVMVSGELHTADTLMPLEEIKRTPRTPKYIFAAPKCAPHMSWNPGPIEGLTVAFFPDAWQTLGGGLDGSPPACLPRALAHFDDTVSEDEWSMFWEDMKRAWYAAQSADGVRRWPGSDHIRTWTYYLLGRAAQTGTGRSIRSMQRRVRRWTGQDIQTLNFFSRIEHLHQLVTEDPDIPSADLAFGAGFADQSHMGRDLKRATGYSPVQLTRLIAENEAFWCYRLLGERL